MKLSILIPTLTEPDRIRSLGRLMSVLRPQVMAYSDRVEIKINDAGRSVPTGTKRNQLIEGSKGEYFCFIDDDDMVSEYYVRELMSAIHLQPDVVTFKGHMTTNGKNHQGFTIKLGSVYDEIDGYYYRYPNHLCCFKRDVVKDVKFQPVWIAEDYQWATDIMKRRLLRTEIHIDKDMYWYDFKTGKNTRRTRR